MLLYQNVYQMSLTSISNREADKNRSAISSLSFGTVSVMSRTKTDLAALSEVKWGFKKGGGTLKSR